MNVVVFTPALKASAIGRMTCLVVRSLIASGHHVTVVRTENERLLESETHDFGVPCTRWTDSAKVAVSAKAADICVYQIGDNYDFHQGAIEWLAKHPGIVCLHDFFLGHLFCGWAQQHQSAAENVLRAWYTDDVIKNYFNYASDANYIELTKDCAPLIEWICSQALGVITHSNWGCQRVLNSCPGPVHVVPLAYDAPGIVFSGDVNKAPTARKLQILTVGHVNKNKRTESCIKAIGSNKLLREQTTYRLAGAIRPERAAELAALATEHSVDLIISGEVDDATLAAAINDSDAIICLRWPSLEAASASAIESMLYGKTTIVTDTGFYSEIPDSCVLKVSPNNEIGDLQSILLALQDGTENTKNIGARAQEWAESTFTAKNYSQELINIASAALQANAFIAASDFFSAILNKWSANPDLLHSKEILQPLDIFK